MDTIQGAELWAVQMVLASITLSEKIYTDCKTVQIGVNAWVAWAGHEANQHAPDGGIRADAQKLEACVTRKKPLRKQLGKEEAVSGAAGGVKPRAPS